VTGTCQWFIQSDRYIKWRQSSTPTRGSSFLWIQGKPGCGKSTLAGQIVRDVQSLSKVVLLYFFCRAGEENKDDLVSILRNLVFQLLDKSPQRKLFHQMVLKVRINAKTAHAQSAEPLWALLRCMLERCSNVCCILDGLDECHNPVRQRENFFNQLTETFAIQDGTTRLMVISRLDPSELGVNYGRWECMQIQSSDVRGDIERFAIAEIQKTQALETHPRKQHILEILVGSSDGMILWTALMIKELRERPWDAEGVLGEPPQGLSEVYRVILDRIVKTVSVRRIRNILQLALAAGRPLRLEEFALGLAVMEGLHCHEDYDSLDATAEGRAIVRGSQPLIIITPDETIELTHSSLRDYLFDAGVHSDISVIHFKDHCVHNTVASAVLTYLSFECFGVELLDREHQKYHFLEYASRWLVHHSARSGDSKGIAQQLVTFFEAVQGWRWLQRLSDIYKLSHGHLQLMQSQLRHWVQTLDLNRGSKDILGGFLLFLARERYRETKSLSIDHSSVLEAMDSLASICSSEGMWKEAEELQVEVLEMEKRMRGQDHPSTLTSTHNLALTYQSQGRWREAEELQVKVVEMDKMILGQGHLATLASMHNLALTYQSQGRWKEAEELQFEVVKMRKRMLGQAHLSTLTSTHNLAFTYQSQGRLTEAEELQVEVMKMRKKILGQEHPSTLASMHNLALTYQSQGRWREAEKLQVEVANVAKRIFGQGHPYTLTSTSNLASTYWYQGQWKEAEELQVEVVEVSKKLLGQENPSTLTSMHNLASTYQGQGRWKEAEELQVNIVEIDKRMFGLKHPSTLASMHNLASTYQSQGRWKEAEKLQIEVVEMRKRTLGQEHPSTLTSIHNLASAYHSQGRWKEAEELQIEVADVVKRVFGQEHPYTLTSMSNLASTYWYQGRWKEAEELGVEVMEVNKRVLGLEHPDSLTSMHNLAVTYQSRGRWKEAEELQAKVMEIRKRVFGQENPSTLSSMGNLALAYLDQGRWKEAEKLLVEVVEVGKRVHGQEHPYVLMSMSSLAYVWKSQDRNEEAIGLMEQVERLQRERLGSNHPLVTGPSQALHDWTAPCAAAETVTTGSCPHLGDLSDHSGEPPSRTNGRSNEYTQFSPRANPFSL
jgi:tetratricopeptide (TPR) repeat protein